MNLIKCPARQWIAAIISTVLFFFTLFVNFSLSAQDRGASLVASPDNEEAVFYESSHALLIGFSDYNNGWNKLPGVLNDIEKVEAALKDHGFEISKHLDLNAADANNVLKDFINKNGYKENSRLLFYIAGHGHTLEIFKNKKGYLVPIDAPLPEEDKGGFLATAIAMDQIETYAKTIGALHTLFIFDACFSGSIFSTSRANVMTQTVEYQITNPVRQFIASGDENQTVPDKSIFVDVFIDGINGLADMGKEPDGFVTATELGMYIQEQVTNISQKAQTPQYGKINDINLSKGNFLFQYDKDAMIKLQVVEKVRVDTFFERVVIRDTLIINNFEGIEDVALKDGESVNDIFRRGYSDGKFQVIGMNMDVVKQRAKVNAGENALELMVKEVETAVFELFKSSYLSLCRESVKKKNEKKIDELLHLWAKNVAVKAVNSADITSYRHQQNNEFYFYHARLILDLAALKAHISYWMDTGNENVVSLHELDDCEISPEDFIISMEHQLKSWEYKLEK